MSADQQTPEGTRGRGPLPWVLLAGGAVIVVLVVALIWALTGSTPGADESDAAAESAPPAATAPDAEYARAARPAVQRLTDSASVTGRVLARSARAADVARVERMASQQLGVVIEARADIAELPRDGANKAATKSLLRATEAHRGYLQQLLRTSGLPPAAAVASLQGTRRQATRALEGYRTFLAEVPEMPRGITTAGLADLSGYRTALAAKRRAAEEAAREQDAARAPATIPVPVQAPESVPAPGDPEALLDAQFLAIKGGDYSQSAAVESLLVSLRTQGHPLRGNAAFNAGLVRYALGDCSGAASAFAESLSAPGTDAQLAIRADALDAAYSGCAEPVSFLIG